MEYQQPRQKTLTINAITPPKVSGRGDPFVECNTDLGVVAFWGPRNISLLQSRRLPLTVTCRCIEPSEGWLSAHALWVPQVEQLRFP